MKALQINERFAEYFDELDYGQMTQLEQSLRKDLTTEPILWWHNPERDQDEILDGHHRFAIAKRFKLDIQFHEKHFANEDEALLFIIRHQTTRRNIADRIHIVRLAMDIETRLSGNKTKREVVAEVSLLTNVSARQIWRDIAPEKNPVEAFKEAKAQLEQVLTRDKNKAVAAFKKEVERDELDEDAAADQWQSIEAEITERHQDRIDEVETLGLAAAQAVEDNPGLRNAGQKRPAKKSTRDRAAKSNTLKKAKSLVAKLQGEVLYFWQQNVGAIDITVLDQALKRFVAEIEAEQERDAKAAKKRKFGGK